MSYIKKILDKYNNNRPHSDGCALMIFIPVTSIARNFSQIKSLY